MKSGCVIPIYCIYSPIIFQMLMVFCPVTLLVESYILIRILSIYYRIWNAIGRYLIPHLWLNPNITIVLLLCVYIYDYYYMSPVSHQNGFKAQFCWIHPDELPIGLFLNKGYSQIIPFIIKYTKSNVYHHVPHKPNMFDHFPPIKPAFFP